MRRILNIAWVAAGVLLATTTLGSATMVRRLTLDATTRRAGRIVQATVSDVHSGRDETGLPATWVTLDVTQTLKGAHAQRFSFKQYGTAEPLADGTLTRVPGLPRYAVGEEVVLFLHPDSARGFTSPVGFGQGCYRVNRRAPRPLARRDSDARSGELDELLSTVRRLAATGQQ